MQACEGKKWQMQPGLSLETFFVNFDMVRMSFFPYNCKFKFIFFSFQFAAGRAIFQTFSAYSLKANKLKEFMRLNIILGKPCTKSGQLFCVGGKEI